MKKKGVLTAKEVTSLLGELSGSKGWYHPDSGEDIELDIRHEHSDVFPDQDKAMKDGWVRYYITPNRIGIESWKLVKSVFKNVQSFIKKKVRKPVTVDWGTIKDKKDLTFLDGEFWAARGPYPAYESTGKRQ